MFAAVMVGFRPITRWVFTHFAGSCVSANLNSSLWNQSSRFRERAARALGRIEHQNGEA